MKQPVIICGIKILASVVWAYFIIFLATSDHYHSLKNVAFPAMAIAFGIFFIWQNTLQRLERKE